MPESLPAWNLKTGDRQWKGGRYGKGQVLLLENSGLLLIAAEDGQVVLLRADPKQHAEVGSFKALDGKTWNHPVIVGDRFTFVIPKRPPVFNSPWPRPRRRQIQIHGRTERVDRLEHLLERCARAARVFWYRLGCFAKINFFGAEGIPTHAPQVPEKALSVIYEKPFCGPLSFVRCDGRQGMRPTFRDERLF
jgi:hypothetical protein